MGKNVWLEKNPIPPIAFKGLFSLKRNGAPGVKTLKLTVPEGCQKFISSGFMPERNSNQLLSVTPK